MALEKNSHHQKEPNRYTLVLVPSDQSKTTKSFSFSVVSVVSIFAAMFFVIVGITLSVLVYTPLGPLVPIPNPELEQLYGKKIVEIQEQVNGLLSELVQLRQYNLHLRKALGEHLSAEDSAMMEQRSTYSTPPVTAMGTDTTKKYLQPENVRTSTPTLSMSELLKSEGEREIQQPHTGEEPFPLMTPAMGYFTRSFDAKNNHLGLDIAGKEGTLVIAAAPGSVLFADWTYNDGFKIILAHNSGYVTVYKHNTSLLKKVGDAVKRAEPIALMGSTGRTSSGPHLHFEVWKNGIALNPVNYLVTIQ